MTPTAPGDSGDSAESPGRSDPPVPPSQGTRGASVDSGPTTAGFAGSPSFETPAENTGEWEAALDRALDQFALANDAEPAGSGNG